MTPQTTFIGGINPFAPPPRIVRMARIKPVPMPRIEKIKPPPKPPAPRKSRARHERRPIAAPKQDKIVDWIAQHPGATSADVMEAMHILEPNCLKQLRTLLKKGRLVRTLQVAGSCHWYTYTATGTQIPLPEKIALDVVYSIKVTDEQRQALGVLGGGKWLRKKIDEAIGKQYENISSV